MRSGAATGHEGFFHETALYESDDEFLAIVVPFIEGGVAGVEPTVVALDDRNAAMVRSALDDTTGLTFLPGADQYSRPATTIALYRELFASHVADGATQVRVVGDVPHPGTGMSWDGWGRYEAASNEAFAEFPVWGLCPYDVRVTPDTVLDEVARTHPHVAHLDGRHDRNPRFEDPLAFLRHRACTDRDPLESGVPAVDLLDPSPSQARRAAEALGRSIDLDAGTIEDLVVAVSEITANAIIHGRSPTRLRLWAGQSRIVAAVTDQGGGPADPLAGLLPVAPDAASGRGLWVTHQLCTELTFGLDADGFTVRFAAGAPRVLANDPR
jgi:anti-sigma regulatory factor (Ser/Thr protein kinase)